MGDYLATFLANTFFNQYFLLFFAAALGALLGRVKIKGFTLGSTGGIFSGIVIGWAVTEIAAKVPEESAAYSSSTLGSASNILSEGVIPASSFVQFIFLLLFIAAVGLLVGKKLKNVMNRQGIKLIVMGLFIPILSMVLTLGCLKVAPALMGDSYNGYQVSGLFSGAMTNSAAYGNSMSVVTNIGAPTIAKEYAEADTASKVRALEMIDLITVSEEGGTTVVTLNYTSEESPETLTVAKGESYRDYITAQADSGAITLPESLEMADAGKFLGKAKGQIATGYAITFPVGTVVVILLMTIIGLIVNKKKNRAEAVEELRSKMGGGTIQAGDDKQFLFDAVVFGLVIGIGILVGNIKIPLPGNASFSLGPVGGVLILALIFGNINKIGPRSITQNPKVLNLVREFALLFFMTVTGLTYGYDVIHAFAGTGIILALMAMVIVIIAMLLSVILGRFILKLNWGLLSGAISGGCTSTVGLGAALNTIGGDEPILGYGVSQPFAILANVILIALFHQHFFI